MDRSICPARAVATPYAHPDSPAMSNGHACARDRPLRRPGGVAADAIAAPRAGAMRH
jgi:hypothetical protein